MFKNYLLFFLFLGATHFVHCQKIQIQGNGIDIAQDGSNIPAIDDFTKYVNVSAGNIDNHVFSLRNIEKRGEIIIVSISADSPEFLVGHSLTRLGKNESGTFDVTFKPTAAGFKNAIVSIRVRKGRKEKIVTFNISGSDSNEADPTDLMITQYYENGNVDEIEIKNLSNKEVKGKTYYLAYYKSGDNINKAPKRGNHIEIKLQPNEVKVYDNFNLTGNEIVLISTKKDKKCFENRIDVIGQQGVLWGEAKSFSKGVCASESAHKEFNPKDWIALSLAEVDNASIKQNIHIGTYQEGPIVWDGSNWTSNALPDRTRAVIIDGLYSSEIYKNIEACDLIVNDELNFDNNGKKSVVVYRDLSITENGSLQLGDQESLVMYDDDAIITGVISKVEKSTPLNDPCDFTYWSAPVSEASVATVFSGVRSGRTYYFDQSKTTASSPDHDPEGTYWNVWVTANGKMKPGRGYASEAKTDAVSIHQLSFEGTPNNGVIYEQIHYNDDENEDLDNDFNLIGNPYPSAIDIELFFDENEGVVDPTVYLWTHTTPVSEQTGDYSSTDYATYNKTGGTAAGNGPIPSENIGSAQGFLVRALSEDEVVFKNSMRIIDGNDQFFKSSLVKKKSKEGEKDRIWLNLSTDQGGFNQLLIGFIEGATSEFDRGYDAIKNQGSNKISFYSVLYDKKLAIQGLGMLESRSEIPLGFDTKVANRMYTIAVSAVEGKLRDAEIVLHDHLRNISHDLRNSNYIFEHDKQGSFQDRFSLTFKREETQSAETTLIKDQFLVYNEGDVFKIETLKSAETVRMYDILGNMIIEKHPRNTSFEIIEPSSKRGDVLIMQIIHADQSHRIKKVYKR